jgi:hypothetical protein
VNREYPASRLFLTTAPTRVLNSLTNVVDPALDALDPDLEGVRSYKVVSLPPRADQLDLAVAAVAELVACSAGRVQDFISELGVGPTRSGCPDGERLNGRATVVTAFTQLLLDLARYIASRSLPPRKKSGERRFRIDGIEKCQRSPNNPHLGSSKIPHPSCPRRACT